MTSITATRLDAQRVAHGVRPVRRWPLWGWFGLASVWWLLGVFNVVWSLVALPVLVALSRRRRLTVPKGFGIWLLFLVCVAASAVQVTTVDRAAAYLYRSSLYVSVTALFLYLYCTPRERLSDDTVLRFLVGFWTVVAVGGVMGVLFPTLRFPSLVSMVLPQSLSNVPYISALLNLEFAQESRILGRPVGRPVAPFPFTNAWGANFALLTPFLIAGLTVVRSRLRRAALIALLLSSVVSVVLSLNRGLWLSLSIGILYAAVRLASSGRVRLLFSTGFVVALIALAVSVSPLGGVVVQRGERGHSDAGRTSLYRQAIELGRQSPLIGWGAPMARASGSGASVGTHGQLWLVIVSNGIPAAVLFVSWYILLLWKTRHERDPVGIWLRASMLIALVQLPIYEQLPSHLHITMVAGALLLRRSHTTANEPVGLPSVHAPALAADTTSNGARP